MNVGTHSNPSKLIVAVLAISTVVVLLVMMINLVRGYSQDKMYNPYLIDGTRLGKKSLVIPGKDLYPSMDGQYGQEFTYSMWLYLEDSNFTGSRGSNMKHIMHKGNAYGNPLQAPGVWLYPYQNKIAINMNTFYSVKESCDVGNLPVNKWFNLTIMLIGRHLDVYINCELKKRVQLKGVPKLNYGDVYITNFDGFDGLISNLRYFNYALQTHEMEKLCSAGPSDAPCTNPSDSTYSVISDDYWLNTGFPNAVGFPKQGNEVKPEKR
jgi:hypothetical protein